MKTKVNNLLIPVGIDPSEITEAFLHVFNDREGGIRYRTETLTYYTPVRVDFIDKNLSMSLSNSNCRAHMRYAGQFIEDADVLKFIKLYSPFIETAAMSAKQFPDVRSLDMREASIFAQSHKQFYSRWSNTLIKYAKDYSKVTVTGNIDGKTHSLVIETREGYMSPVNFDSASMTESLNGFGYNEKYPSYNEVFTYIAENRKYLIGEDK